MFEMISFPYNNRPVARLDFDNIVHNHIYHNCPVGRVCANLVYDNKDNVIGKVDESGYIYSYKSESIGRVDINGFVHKDDMLIGKIKCFQPISPNLAGAAYLLLIHNKR